MTSGFDLAELSKTVRPQDDLYQYVNSEWIERTTMPQDKARYGTFDILADGAELAIRAILDEARTAPEGGEARKVGDLYSSFLDEERIRARGVRPLIDRLAQVDALSSIDELLALALVAFTRSSLTTTRVTPNVTSCCSNRADSRSPMRATTAKNTSRRFATPSSRMCSACSNWPE